MQGKLITPLEPPHNLLNWLQSLITAGGASTTKKTLIDNSKKLVLAGDFRVFLPHKQFLLGGWGQA